MSGIFDDPVLYYDNIPFSSSILVHASRRGKLPYTYLSIVIGGTERNRKYYRRPRLFQGEK